VAVLLAAPALSAQSVSAPLTVTTLAGSAGQRQATDGSGAAARFYEPTGIIVDASGNLIVADDSNNIFRKVTPDGTVSTFAGSAIDLANRPINIGSSDGTGGAASFHIGEYASTGGPWDEPIYTTFGSYTLGVDGQGNIYLADTLNYTIRKITKDGVVSTIAGSPGSQGTADGDGANARFLVPGGVAADSAGNVYVADSGNNAIRKIDTSGTVSTIAGTAGQFGSADGSGAAARFLNPVGIAVDSQGNLYVTDKGNHTVRKITSGVVTTLAGAAGQSGSADGSGSQARFNGPTGIAVDASGNVYVADTGNNAIRRISPTGTVTTVAGTKGTAGSADGTGTAALFNHPRGIALSASGIVYIADTDNNTIRRGVVDTSDGSLQVTSVPPASVQVVASSNVTLKIAASGTPAPTYQWSKNGTAISGATTSTLQLNSVTSADQANYSVLVTSGSLTYSSAPTTLQVFASGTVVPSVVIVSQPTDRTVNPGQSASFAVEASSAGTLTYQWNKSGTPIPGATASTYTIASAGASDVASYSVTVTDGSSTVTTTPASLTVSGVTVVAPSFTTQPLSQTLSAGATATFTAAASGTPAPSILWQKNGVNLSDGGTISGATTSTLTITGISAADAGNYTAVASNSAGTATSNAATLTIGSSQPPSDRGHISNLSVLTSVNPNENFTFGYYLGGDGTSGTKPILMRAMGPTLGAAPFSIPGTLSDPFIEFFNSSTKVSENDNWGGDATIRTAAASVGAFPFVSDDSKDAAIFNTTVDPSVGHSIRVSGVNGSSGTVIAELYDTTPTDQMTATTPRLINVSLIKNAGERTTLGFYIVGSSPVKVLVRAVGPTLALDPFNVGGTIADPKMALFVQGADTPFATNDDWVASTEMEDARVKTGAFPLAAGSKDAAMLQTLQPGGYSVQVSPSTGATGTALLEVYEVPAP
jgi:sugar lactone lactonase YvrE